MSTTGAITHEQVEKTMAWIRDFYAAAETDARRWITGFFHPDAAIAFTGQPPTVGQEAMISYFEQFNSIFSSIKHIVERVDVLSDRVYIQLDVEFIVKNDPEQKTIRITGIVATQKKIDEDKVSFYTIYSDKTPLDQRIKMFH
jgi:hypothetical protein